MRVVKVIGMVAVLTVSLVVGAVVIRKGGRMTGFMSKDVGTWTGVCGQVNSNWQSNCKKCQRYLKKSEAKE